MAYTFLDFAAEVLANSAQPLTYQEIWQVGEAAGYPEKLNSGGKTPWQTLGARLFVDVRDNPSSKFVKLGGRPARFFLKERASLLPEGIIEAIELSEQKEPQGKIGFSERDLHPLLAYFAYTNPSFVRGRNILTKTIFHEKSKKSGYNEWSHPDIVGFHLPLEEWGKDLIDFNRITNANALKLYSFELKKSITKGNYRESFFQAVSNSSWANEGYLVTASIKQDDELLSELGRLSSSFGIGIVQLDLEDIDSSMVVFPARSKLQLDWEMMSKLATQNSDFKKFLADVKIDFDSNRIHISEYDQILDDPEGYIRKKLGPGSV